VKMGRWQLRHGIPHWHVLERLRAKSRMSQTVTGYLDEIGAMLAAPRFADSSLGSGLRQQITEFNAYSV